MSTVLVAIIVITVVISLYGFQNRAFFEKYKFNVAEIQNKKEYIRFLSSGFLHADYMHLFFNMFTLYFFAPIVISSFGDVGFLLIYLGSILLGNIFTYYIYSNQPWYSAIGASGGVSGILFASIAMYPSLGIYLMFIPIPVPGYIFAFLYFAYSVYMMLNPSPNDRIGHVAHIGGAIFGLLYAVIFQPEMAFSNAKYIFIMSIPLLYMSYQIFGKKRLG